MQLSCLSRAQRYVAARLTRHEVSTYMIRTSVLSEDVVERHLEELEEAVDDN